MSQVRNGDKVRVHYTGKFEDGDVFDSSEGADPLEFIVGIEQVFPGFDQAVVGMAIGESKAIVIPAPEAYGERNPDLVQTINREQFSLGGIVPAVGMSIEMQTSEGSIPLVITELNEASVTLDANHPLAGRDLHFDLMLVAIEG
ncbi:MAG: peptidylprolyl isomerase [Acidobacteria bacterium]|nr:peptidylprolyl isomerase [Acidobacteriota bacterium]